MAFLFLSQTLRRLLSGFYALKAWIEIILISPFSRLVHCPTFRDVEVVRQMPLQAFPQ
jgi:hypothetical protein